MTPSRVPCRGGATSEGYEKDWPSWNWRGTAGASPSLAATGAAWARPAASGRRTRWLDEECERVKLRAPGTGRDLGAIVDGGESDQICTSAMGVYATIEFIAKWLRLR